MLERVGSYLRFFGDLVAVPGGFAPTQPVSTGAPIEEVLPLPGGSRPRDAVPRLTAHPHGWIGTTAAFNFGRENTFELDAAFSDCQN